MLGTNIKLCVLLRTLWLACMCRLSVETSATRDTGFAGDFLLNSSQYDNNMRYILLTSISYSFGSSCHCFDKMIRRNDLHHGYDL